MTRRPRLLDAEPITNEELDYWRSHDSCGGACEYGGYLWCEQNGRSCAEHVADERRSRELLAAALGPEVEEPGQLTFSVAA